MQRWGSLALEQKQALIPNTMHTMLALFLLWNKDLKVNKLEVRSVRSTLSRHFFAGLVMTLRSKYQIYI